MTEIFSNHPQNYQSFDEAQQGINRLGDFHEQHNKLYDTLGPIFPSAIFDSMQQIKVQNSHKLDQQQADLQAHKNWGVEKVHTLQATDQQLAGGF